jgi:hypothetical protein
LTKFTKDADSEFDMIGQNAMKELDQIGDQVSISCDGRLNSTISLLWCLTKNCISDVVDNGAAGQ